MDIWWEVVTMVAAIIVLVVVAIVALFREAINAYIGARSVRPIVKYQTTAEEELQFDRRIKDPIYHTCDDTRLWHKLAKCNIIAGGLRCDEYLSNLITIFLSNFKSGNAEASLHCRDDCLLRIIMMSSGVAIEIERYKVDEFASENRRVDCLLHSVGQPILVAVEEKDDDYKVRDAEADLMRKVRLTQAHGQLPFIVCIAIAGDTVVFSKMYRDSNLLKDRISYDLFSVDSRIDCVVAAVNIGRWIKWAVASNSMLPVSYHFGISYTNERRNLCIAFDTVTKTYKTLSRSEKMNLKKFYVDCKDAMFIEKAIVVTQKGYARGSLTLELTPVGVTACRPMFTCIADVVLCVACIVTAIESAHMKNWCLLDLRWPNIIRVKRDSISGPVRWFIVDCEFATQVGSALPSTIEHLIPQNLGRRASKRLDWYMLAQMLGDAGMFTYEYKTSACGLKEYLESMTDNSSSPRHHEFFNGLNFNEL